MATMRFYFDEMMPRPVANELSKRGYDVTRAVDVEMTGKDDPEHLKYATEQGRVLVTQDRGFAGRSSKQTDHVGVICWIGIADDFGGQIRVFSTFGEQYEPEQVIGQVFWLK